VITQELLDSESWGAVLETYASCVDVAVALTDRDGALIGKVHNAKPIWKKVRAVRLDWQGCPFCLDKAGHCTAAAEASETRGLVFACGMGGFAHTAIPIFLHDQHMGTLLAGQVFDQYPELLLLERVAREYGLSGQELWRLARQRVPVSYEALRTYGLLLGTLGQAYLEQRHATILQRELAESNEGLKNANCDLDIKVAELHQSLIEKDILLNEVHHRVNNNLAVIGSLLRMQAASFPDSQVADALRETQLRVDSMALIHAHLYNAVDWRAVDFASYATVLAENLFRAYGVDQSRIQLRVEIGALQLGVDKAIPAGLILNELISNALKHAFPEGRNGSLLLEGKLQGCQVELSVHDDGVGIGGSAIRRLDASRKSLGMNIINILCHQLKGTLEPPQGSPDNGSTFRFSFPQAIFSRAAAL
jgi:two-component sensor histidine kinase/ligand-binding sensor protein